MIFTRYSLEDLQLKLHGDKMFDKNGMLIKKEFSINIKDAKRLVDSLEFTADFDKTDIYYHLKEWVKENES